MYVFVGLPPHKIHLKTASKTLATTLRMEGIIISSISIHFVHGYLQHAGPACRGKHSLQFLIYFIPVPNVMMDAIRFDNGRNFSFLPVPRKKVNTSSSQHSSSGMEGMDSDVECSDDYSSKIDSSGGNNSYSQLGHLVLKDYCWNE